MPLARPLEFVVCPLMCQIQAFRYFRPNMAPSIRGRGTGGPEPLVRKGTWCCEYRPIDCGDRVEHEEYGTGSVLDLQLIEWE